MPDIGVLDTLVKLASLGTSGVCIFAIFWIGWLLLKSDPAKNIERQRTLRFYMIACVAIAVIQVAAAFVTGRTDARQLDALKEQINSYESQYIQYRVKGIVVKDDNSDPGDITITTQFPPLSPDGSGRIVSLLVKRNKDGKFPSLSFSAFGYSIEGVYLDDFVQPDATGADNVIDINKITLHKIPE